MARNWNMGFVGPNKPFWASSKTLAPWHSYNLSLAAQRAQETLDVTWSWLLKDLPFPSMWLVSAPLLQLSNLFGGPAQRWSLAVRHRQRLPRLKIWSIHILQWHCRSRCHHDPLASINNKLATNCQKVPAALQAGAYPVRNHVMTVLDTAGTQVAADSSSRLCRELCGKHSKLWYVDILLTFVDYVLYKPCSKSCNTWHRLTLPRSGRPSSWIQRRAAAVADSLQVKSASACEADHYESTGFAQCSNHACSKVQNTLRRCTSQAPNSMNGCQWPAPAVFQLF